MRILSLEFSSRRRSVALLDTSQGAAGGQEIQTDAVEPMTPRAGQNPLGLVQSVLKKAGVTRAEVEMLAVGIGPGSYTGIRNAIALVQGWQLARGTPCTGVRSDLALAHQARSMGLQGAVHVVFDAQRGEFYLATYRVNGPDQPVETVQDLRLCSRSDLETQCDSADHLIGPDLESVLPQSRNMAPSALMLAQLAEMPSATATATAETLEPVYLREAQFVKAPPGKRW